MRSIMRSGACVVMAAVALACGEERPAESRTDVGVPLDVQEPAPAKGAPVLARARGVFEQVPLRGAVVEKEGISFEEIELGKMLYMDPRLSSSWLISCNTCHNLALGGVDLNETSIGHGWQKGPRNAPTVLNAVFNIAQFWDGRAENLEEQAKGPVQAALEMGNTPERVTMTLNSIPGYVERFRAAFPDDPEPVSFDNMAHAIEAFESTLVTPGSPFDRYLDGDEDALQEEEIDGLALFMDRGCAACHRGVNLGGTGYFPFGVVEKPGAEILPPGDRGRFDVTRTARDEYVFKSPSLRNIELTPPYFHSGKVWDLGKAISIMGSSQLGAELTDDEVLKIALFLETLTGLQPHVGYPVLPPHTAATPKPDVTVQ